MKPGTGARLYVTAPVDALVEGFYRQDSTTAEFCRAQRVRIGVRHFAGRELGLPPTLDYLTADLSRDTRADLAEAEK